MPPRGTKRGTAVVAAAGAAPGGEGEGGEGEGPSRRSSRSKPASSKYHDEEVSNCRGPCFSSWELLPESSEGFVPQRA